MNQDKETLDNVQLKAVRVIAGLPIYASRDSLYKETGWKKIKTVQIRGALSIFVPSLLKQEVQH